MHDLSRQKLSLPPEEAVLPFTYHLFLSLCYLSLCLWLGIWSELEPTIIWAGLVLAWSVSLQGCTEFFCANTREGTMWRQGWSRCLEKRELRCHQLKEFMKLQPFSWLCFAGVQLMRSVEFLLFCHVSIVPHPSLHNRWSTQLHIPLSFSHHSCFPRWDAGSTEFSEDVAVTAAYIPGRTVESGGQRENCNQRDLTFHRWGLQQAALALQLLLHLHNSLTWASSWLNHSWTNCLTLHVPNSSLCTDVDCRRDLNRADAFSCCCGSGLCLVCWSAAADPSFLRPGSKSWYSRDQLALSHSPGVFCIKCV